MSDESAENVSLDLGRYWATLKSRWPVVLGGAIAGTLLAAAYAVSAPTTYTATAMVNLNVIADEPFSTQRSASGLIDPATESQLARSSEVLTDAAADLGGGTTIADVRRSMTVTVLPEATVARITYSASSLNGALAGADAVGKAFVDYRTVAAQDKVDRIRSQLSEQQSSVNRELTAVNKAVADASSSSQRAAAISRRDVLETQVSALLSQLSSVASIDTSGGYVITKAEDNAVAIQPHVRLLLQIGLAAGLVLGVIAAFVVNALDRRLATAADVAKAQGGPLLARLGDRLRSVPPAAVDADAYRSAAERLIASGRRSFTVVDMTSRSEPSVAVNLALGLVSSGSERALVVLSTDDEDTARTLISDHGGRAVASPLPKVGALAVSLGPPTTARVGHDAGGYLVVALSAASPRSALLAAARRTTSVVTVVESRRTKAGTVRSLADDLTTVGGVVVGSVMAARAPRRATRHRKRRAAESEKHAPVAAADGV